MIVLEWSQKITDARWESALPVFDWLRENKAEYRYMGGKDFIVFRYKEDLLIFKLKYNI